MRAVLSSGSDGSPGAATTWPSFPPPIEFRLRASVAWLAGVLLGLCHPTPGWSGLVWLVPGLLLTASMGASPQRAFRWGCAAGAVESLIALRWLLHIPFPAGAVVGWIALSAYLSVFTGAWCAWVAWTLRAQRRLPPEEEDLPISWGTSANAYCSMGWWRRTAWIAGAAAAWVALEMIQARLFTGFPWNGLGVTQWRNGPLIQLASVTGVYGVSFLIAWGSLALASAALLVFFKPALRFAWMAEGRFPLVVLLILVGWGFNRMMEGAKATGTGTATATGRRVSLGLVQPSIPQELIWNEAASPERFEKARRLSAQVLATRPDVLVWPEGFLPPFSENQLAEMTRLVGQSGAWWIFGADDADPDKGGGTRPNAYNAAVLASPTGRFERVYRKRHLVIFGEYIPFSRQLPFLKSLIPIGDGFAAGSGPVPFPIQTESGPVVVSPVICFEDIFPHHTRDQIQPATDLLLELTNDGWFGESGAQWQHCANAAFRAVENGIPLVRCANNGITGWIDAFGRLRDVAGGEGGNVYGAGFLRIQVSLPPVGSAVNRTWYSLHGDVFGWTCVAWASWLLVRAGLARRTAMGRNEARTS